MLPGSACVSTIWDFDLLFKELGVQTGEMAYQLRVNTAQQKTQVRFSASTPGSSQLLVNPSAWDLMLLSSMAWVLTVTFPHIEWDTYKQLKKRERRNSMRRRSWVLGHLPHKISTVFPVHRSCILRHGLVCT